MFISSPVAGLEEEKFEINIQKRVINYLNLLDKLVFQASRYIMILSVVVDVGIRLALRMRDAMFSEASCDAIMAGGDLNLCH